MSHRFVLTGVFSLALLCITGCGGGPARPNIVPVSGKVLYKGKPVSGASVSFMGEASPRSAVGKTNDQGEFVLTTYDSNDGAPVGKHSVIIIKAIASIETNMTGEDGSKKAAEMMSKMRQTSSRDKKPKSLPIDTSIPVRYANPKESGLSMEVIEGDENKFTIELVD